MIRLFRVAVLFAVALGVLAVVAPVPARADPIGGVIVIPGSGSDLVAIRVRTTAGCPAQATGYYARMRGRGLPPDGQVVTANTAAGLSRSVGFDVYFAQTMKDFAQVNRATLGGRYDITVLCIDSFTTQSFGEFTGSLEFTSPTHYEALGAAKPTGPVPPPLDLAGDGSAVAPDGAAPPAGTPPAADPPSRAAQDQPAPPATAGSTPGVGSPPPSVADQLTSERNDATGQGTVWPVLVGAVLVLLVVVVLASRIRKRRCS